LTRFPSPPFSCFLNCSSKLRHIHEADQKETIKYSAENVIQNLSHHCIPLFYPKPSFRPSTFNLSPMQFLIITSESENDSILLGFNGFIWIYTGIKQNRWYVWYQQNYQEQIC
jgi:hypothetical protein